MYARKELLAKVLNWRDQDVIKVLTGMRRSGKSTLMEMVVLALRESGVGDDRIAYLNFERRECWGLDSREKVFAELDRRLKGPGRKYVLLDEVQNVGQFESLVDALYADKQYDCYIAGSNAYLLSSELATFLSGRYVEIHVTPLSFAEYLDGQKASPLEAWRDYVRYGSMPKVRELVETGKTGDVAQYLDGLYCSVLVHDVVTRTKMSDVSTVKKIAAYLFDNISNLTNVKRICDALSSVGGKGSYQSTQTYVHQLCEAFLFYKCERLDVRGLELLKVGAKYYTADPGLRYLINGNRAGDEGRILENVVYLELARRCRHVFTGVLRNGREIDFVTRNGDEIVYYQVADSVKNPETLARELRPLCEIDDNYPKYLIVGDYGNAVMHDGIRQICVQDFLRGIGN